MGLFNFFGMLFIIVMLHEAGHLIVAKLCNVRVKTFSIGFGPRLIGIKIVKDDSGQKHFCFRILKFRPNNWRFCLKRATEYRIAPIFLGGFVSMEGESESTGQDTDLVNKPYWQKVMVSLAGVTVNFITGFIAILYVITSNMGFTKGFGATIEYIIFATKAIVIGILDLFVGQAQILSMSDTADIMTGLSLDAFLLCFGIFSIALGIFNLIPIPALDGSLPILWLIEKTHKIGKIISSWLLKIGITFLIIAQVVLLVYWIFG